MSGSTADTPTVVSVLIPVFNEEDNIERAYSAVREIFAALHEYDHEIVFTDNHSTDRSFKILASIAARDPKVRVLRFARNYGYQRSLLVAYQTASGACSIQIDCDLQDPPALIPEMLKLWRQGHQVVYGVRRTLKDGPVLAFVRRAFYFVVNFLSEDELPLNAGEFRLVDACVLQELRRVEDTSPYIRGLISSMGFSQIGFEYDRGARVAGESKFPFWAMVSLAVDGILNHSLIPLRLASLTALVVGMLALVFSFVFLIGKLFFGQDWPAGFATITIVLLISLALNAMFMGIMGEYLGRIFMQAKRRPIPIVERALNLTSDQQRLHLSEPTQHVTFVD